MTKDKPRGSISFSNPCFTELDKRLENIIQAIVKT